MPNSILEYFRDATGDENIFYPPASEEQISTLESQLKIVLPADYKDFLRSTNGFDGFINNFVAIFEPAEKVYESTLLSCSEYFPWAIFIGSNGNLEMFVIDNRQLPYQFGLLPYIADNNDFIPLGDTFEKFIKHLYDDTAFNKSL